MNRPNGTNAICPFYETDGPVSITCEGIVDDTTTTTRFKNAREKRRFVAYCCQQHNAERRCPIAAMITAKYDDT